jgi:hypothetical protein
MRRLLTLDGVLASAAACLAVAGVVFIGLAAKTPRTDCTFDNFSCRANDFLGDGIRCLFWAAVAGGFALLVRRLRKRHNPGHTPPDL